MFKIGDIVEYVGGDISLLGLTGIITSIDQSTDTLNVSFYYLNSIYSVKEEEIQMATSSLNNTIKNVTVNFNPSTSIWGGYEPSEIQLTENGKISFANMHKCNWKFYFGLNEKFEFCTECDAKREIKE